MSKLKKIIVLHAFEQNVTFNTIKTNIFTFNIYERKKVQHNEKTFCVKTVAVDDLLYLF